MRESIGFGMAHSGFTMRREADVGASEIMDLLARISTSPANNRAEKSSNSITGCEEGHESGSAHAQNWILFHLSLRTGTRQPYPVGS